MAWVYQGLAAARRQCTLPLLAARHAHLAAGLANVSFETIPDRTHHASITGLTQQMCNAELANLRCSGGLVSFNLRVM